MKSQKFNYSNYDKNLKKEEEILDSIFRKLTKNREEKNSLKKLEQLIKSKLDIKNLLPSSKSFEGENLLTLSKFWMILILIKITKGKKQQNDFLTLVNSSLTHDLNEYEEYLEFFMEQCEQLFSDDEAIDRINSNPLTKTKFEKPTEHEEIRNNYIYLLFRPNYFKKIQLEGISKMKKLEKKSNKSRSKSKSRSVNKSRSGKDEIIYINDSEESDEKGDRLDENDMISKIKAIKKNKNQRGKGKTTSFKKNKKDDEDEEKSDYKSKKIEKIDKRKKRKAKDESEEVIIISDKEEEKEEKSPKTTTYKKRGRKPKNKKDEKEEEKKDKKNYNKNHKKKIESIDSEDNEINRSNPKKGKEKEKEKEKEKKPKGRTKGKKN